MKKSKVLFLVVSTLMVASLLLAACQPAAPAAEAPAEGEKKFKAAMLTDLGGLSGSEDTKGFTDLCWDGFVKARDELGIEILLIEAREQADYEPNLVKAAEQGYDYVLGCGFLLTDAINAVAPRFPETKFAIVDSVVEGENTESIVFAEHEGSFLVGAIAAGMSETGTIGYVGGMEVPSIIKFEAGYIAGARAINPDIEVLSAYAGSFTDAAKGKELALGQFNKGADIIFHASGGTGLGVIEAATQVEKYAIGVDIDQDALSKGFVLVSMLKRVEVGVFNSLKDTIEGNFKGGIRVNDLKSNGVGYSDMRFTKDKVPAELLAKVDKLAEMIKAGDVVVPDTMEALDAFTPPTVE